MGPAGVALRSGFDDCERQPLGAPKTNEPVAASRTWWSGRRRSARPGVAPVRAVSAAGGPVGDSSANVTVVIPDLTGVTSDELGRYAAQLSQVPDVSAVSAPGGTFVGGSLVGPAAGNGDQGRQRPIHCWQHKALFSQASETQLDRLHAVAGPGGRRVQMTGIAGDQPRRL